MKEIKTKYDLYAHLENNKFNITLLYFTAPWCGPCRIQGPILDEVEKEKGISILKLNIDEGELFSVVQQMNITSVPTILFMRGTEKLETHIGVMAKDKVLAKLQDFTTKLMG